MNKINKNEIIIGFLLLIPMYMIIFILLYYLNLQTSNNAALFPIILYLPIISGIMLSYKLYGDKINKPIGITTIIFCLIAYYFYYNTYFVEHEGWDGIGYYLFWALNTVICRIFSCIFYYRIVGLKKAILSLLIYIIILASSIIFGFWA